MIKSRLLPVSKMTESVSQTYISVSNKGITVQVRQWENDAIEGGKTKLKIA